jgi:aryl-alcohol dehydrogenase-like predicted oxidoreductase
MAIATCLGALDRGINLIDTAPIYGHGHAEEIVGRAMRAYGQREAFFIATKAGLEWNDAGVFANSTEPRLRQELEDSLRRLGTETIDLYQIHWPDTKTPIAETAAVLAKFQREGKVRALGVSNFSVAQMKEFQSAAPLATNQLPYNLFERQIDRGSDGAEAVLPWCEDNGVAVLTYSSLCRSLLGGRVRRGMSFAEGDIRRVDPKFQEPRFSQYITAVEKLDALAKDRFGKTVRELSVRWLLNRPGVSVALWGAKRPDQLNAVADVMELKLRPSTLDAITRIVADSITDPVGPEYLAPAVREG